MLQTLPMVSDIWCVTYMNLLYSVRYELLIPYFWLSDDKYYSPLQSMLGWISGAMERSSRNFHSTHWRFCMLYDGIMPAIVTQMPRHCCYWLCHALAHFYIILHKRQLRWLLWLYVNWSLKLEFQLFNRPRQGFMQNVHWGHWLTVENSLAIGFSVCTCYKFCITFVEGCIICAMSCRRLQ